MTFGLKDYTTKAPTLHPPITPSAEQQFDGAELNRSGSKDLAAEDSDRASTNVDVAVTNSTSTLTQEVRTMWILGTCYYIIFISTKIDIDLLEQNS